VGSGLSIGVRIECRQLNAFKVGKLCEEVRYASGGEKKGIDEVFESHRKGGRVFDRWMLGASGVSCQS
jgi:hypothetical protein